MPQLPPKTYLFTGSKPGNTSVILAGVHGDERAGIIALEQLLSDFRIKRGKVFVIFGNPAAIQLGVRQVEENLNRCFLPNQTGTSLEARRAQELLPILDQSSAVLDLHATHSTASIPFIIVAGAGLPLARQLNFPILSTGWNILEPGGTDGYMASQGKIGICAECGSMNDEGRGVQIAMQTITDFLILRGHREGVSSKSTPKRIVEVQQKVCRQTNDFRFRKNFADFERLPAGEAFAWDGPRTFIAQPEQCIIFARPGNAPGDQVFILGAERA
ncbi:MAG: succinylglutamate desuccinylase/aspartoacylase family protein [Patescibacteria group bacterium]|jgi:succinylglutamate desuccinylase